MSKLPTKSGGTTLTVAKSGHVVTAVLEKIPTEAIVKVVDLVADVARASKTIEGRSQEFEYTLTMLREGNLDRRERMSMLSNLLTQMDLNEEAQMRLVDSICKIAEGS